MPRTPDRFPGTREDEALIIEDTTTQPAVLGEFRHDAGSLYAKDSVGVFNLRSGSGITEPQHEDLNTLTHWIAENAFHELTRTGNKVTNYTIWTDSGKTTKVREVVLAFTGNLLNQADIIQYDGAGTESNRVVVDTMNYTGSSLDDFETTKT
jgi:hypothetical protein